MKEKTKNIILYSIATLFLIIVILNINSYIQDRLYSSILWMCYTGMTLIAIGIIFKKPNLILSQIIILLIPDVLWTFDLITILITGNSPLGAAQYVLNQSRGLLFSVLSFHHLFAIPLSLFAMSLIKIKPNPKSIIISSIEIVIFFILGLIGCNVNYLPQSEYSHYFPQFIPYPIIWITVMSLFLIISYFIITRLPLLRKTKEMKA